MRIALSLALLSMFLVGCNMNPNKEARIQKLETEIQIATESISSLDTKVQTLQNENATLVVRVKELEAQ